MLPRFQCKLDKRRCCQTYATLSGFILEFIWFHIWIYLVPYLNLSGSILVFIWFLIWIHLVPYLNLSGSIFGFIWFHIWNSENFCSSQYLFKKRSYNWKYLKFLSFTCICAVYLISTCLKTIKFTFSLLVFNSKNSAVLTS